MKFVWFGFWFVTSSVSHCRFRAFSNCRLCLHLRNLKRLLMIPSSCQNIVNPLNTLWKVSLSSEIQHSQEIANKDLVPRCVSKKRQQYFTNLHILSSSSPSSSTHHVGHAHWERCLLRLRRSLFKTKIDQNIFANKKLRPFLQNFWLKTIATDQTSKLKHKQCTLFTCESSFLHLPASPRYLSASTQFLQTRSIQLLENTSLSFVSLSFVSLSLVPPALQLDQGPGQLLAQSPLPLGQAGLEDAVHRDVLSAQLHLQVKSNLQGVP